MLLSRLHRFLVYCLLELWVLHNWISQQKENEKNDTKESHTVSFLAFVHAYALIDEQLAHAVSSTLQCK